jgi:hypothetical protein
VIEGRRFSAAGLVTQDSVIGLFRGLVSSNGGISLQADVVIMYRSDLHTIPLLGQFVLVTLASDREALLGRISSVTARGELPGDRGVSFIIECIKTGRPVPEDVREGHLHYEVTIHVLGTIESRGDGIVYSPTARRLPHTGSLVGFVPPHLLPQIVSASQDASSPEIGVLALGEFVYSGPSARGGAADPRYDDGRGRGLIRHKDPRVPVRFDVRQLIARRTLVLARSGYGKSNLTKLLISELYRNGPPTVRLETGGEARVGMLILDPDGEYFWADQDGNPGLCDIPWLRDHVVVFTDRTPPSSYYAAFVAGGPKVDIRAVKAEHIVAAAIPESRQEHQNVAKLRSLDIDRWDALVDMMTSGAGIADEDIEHLVSAKSTAEIGAVRSNMRQIIEMLHRTESDTATLLDEALRLGKICVVDVSLMRGRPAFALGSVLLKRIFEANQRAFTGGTGRVTPVIAVIEEAQAVVGADVGHSDEAYVEWVKEGRKYSLGAVLVTQRPGSIDSEIRSQADNWFVFHMVSGEDLAVLHKDNAHFSEDIQRALLHETLVGHCVMWNGAPGGIPYPVSLRVASLKGVVAEAPQPPSEPPSHVEELKRRASAAREEEDRVILACAEALQANQPILAAMRDRGVSWRELAPILNSAFRARDSQAAELPRRRLIVRKALSRILRSPVTLSYSKGSWKVIPLGEAHAREARRG